MTQTPEGNLTLKFLKSLILQTFNYAFISVKPWIFCGFIINYICPKHFIEIPQLVQKL